MEVNIWIYVTKIISEEKHVYVQFRKIFMSVWKLWFDMFSFSLKGLGAIRAKIGPTSDVDKIFSKMYSQYVLFRNKYS